MDDVDNGIKMLVEAIAEAQYKVENGVTSTPVRSTSPNKYQTHKGLLLAAEETNGGEKGLAVETDDSINSGYTADTSNVQPSWYKSPVTNRPIDTPPSPTANLKMLVAAASSALDRENAAETSQNQMDKDDEGSSRKMKSLALLCKRFLQVADQEIGPGKEFSLEMIATSLGINRRRIYDIINVMEALEMISKQSKNWYLWHGQSNLVTTLAKLKAMAVDDPDIQPFLDANLSGENNKENETCNKNNNSNQASSEVPPPTAPPPTTTTNAPTTVKTTTTGTTGTGTSTGSGSQVRDPMEEEDDDDDDIPAAARSVRYDKSLGVLCQKFVMLFLISACTEITLEDAGKILVPDYHNDTLYMALNPSVNPKTKVRRLYDIANILSSLGLIKKKVFVGPHHIKKPGYAWSGPSLADIEAISVARKNEYTFNRGFMRRSISSRPYLHQYEVQSQQQQDNDGNLSTGSAPNSPKTPAGSKFKRSLSFGGGISTTSGISNTEGTKQSPPTVLARPLCPKQVDYLREMKEFESEMQRHSHRYPHVASIFHEFLQKYQSTMEQSASANGRYILPKAAANDTSTPSLTLNTSSDSPNNNNNDITATSANTGTVVQPTIAELSDSLPNTVPSMLEHNHSTAANTTAASTSPSNIVSEVIVPSSPPPHSISNNNNDGGNDPPSCRFETRAEMSQINDNKMTPLAANEVPSTATRESCAVREKQKALERLVMKQPSSNNNTATGLPGYTTFQAPPQVTSPSVINIPTSTLVTNLANSILVNVLQNNMLEAVAASNNAATGGAPPIHRGTLHSNQPQPAKPNFIHIDDLLMKSGSVASAKENCYPPGNRPQQPSYHDNRSLRPLRNLGPLVSQLHNNRPLLEGIATNGGSANNPLPSFNPNHFLTSQVLSSPLYTQCSGGIVAGGGEGNSTTAPTSANIIMCQQQQAPTNDSSGMCVGSNTTEPHSPKRPRLE